MVCLLDYAELCGFHRKNKKNVHVYEKQLLLNGLMSQNTTGSLSHKIK